MVTKEHSHAMGLPSGSVAKNPPAVQEPLEIKHPWEGKIPCRRAWEPTPVFLPGESHGQRSLARPGPRGHKESDMTQRLRKSNHSTRCDRSALPAGRKPPRAPRPCLSPATPPSRPAPEAEAEAAEAEAEGQEGRRVWECRRHVLVPPATLSPSELRQ